MLYLYLFFFIILPRPPRSTRTDTLFPYTTLFRSLGVIGCGCAIAHGFLRAQPIPETKNVPFGPMSYASNDVAWWPGRESTPRHGDFLSPALPTELPGRNASALGRARAE